MSTTEKQMTKKQTTQVGNLTRSPEMHEGKVPFVVFGLAVNRPKEPGNWSGERVTEFYDVKCWRSLAENVMESLDTGDRVVVQGNGRVESYEAKDGTTKTRKVIEANAIGVELRFASVTGIVKNNSRKDAFAEEPDEDF